MNFSYNISFFDKLNYGGFIYKCIILNTLLVYYFCWYCWYLCFFMPQHTFFKL